MRGLSIVATAAVMLSCRGWESEKPPVHLIPNMQTQERGMAYRKDTTGLFADSRVMRPPVEGTVAQGQLKDDDALHLGVDDKGAPVTKFPATVAVDDTLRARGKERYQVFCAPCHGVALDGKGTVASKGLVVPPPSFLDERLKEMTVGKLYAAIAQGVNNGNMASYAAQIPVEDRWAIIAGIRAYQREKDPAVVDEPQPGAAPAVASNKPSADLGKFLFKDKGCNACHSLDGARIVGPTMKGLYGKQGEAESGPYTADEAYLKEAILKPMAKVVKGYPPAMPALPLNDVEVQSLVLFIQTQK